MGYRRVCRACSTIEPSSLEKLGLCPKETKQTREALYSGNPEADCGAPRRRGRRSRLGMLLWIVVAIILRTGPYMGVRGRVRILALVSTFIAPAVGRRGGV